LIKKLLFTMGLLVSSLSILFAQTETKKTFFAVHTGLTRLAAPKNLSNSWQSGVNLGVELNHALKPRFLFVGTLNYNHFYFDQQSFLNSLKLTNPEEYFITSKAATMITLLGNLKMLYPTKTGGRATPYLFGGIGVLYLNYADRTIYGPESEEVRPGETEFALALRAGLGAEISIETTTLFAEVGANFGLTKDNNTIFFPFKLGIQIK